MTRYVVLQANVLSTFHPHQGRPWPKVDGSAILSDSVAAPLVLMVYGTVPVVKQGQLNGWVKGPCDWRRKVGP